MASPPDVPLVSVLCICGDHARFVGECLSSLEAQTWPNLEVLVLDNASTDGSLEVLEAWAAKTRLRHAVIRQDRREGVCRNFNRLFAQAGGEFFCLLAADDRLLPEKVERQARRLQSAPDDIAVVYSDAFQIDEEGGRLPQHFIFSHRKRNEYPEGDVLGALLKGNWIPAMGAMTRRVAWESCGPWDETLVFEDWDMWLRLAAGHRFAYDPVPSAEYRIVATSLSRAVLHRATAASRCSVATIKAKASAVPRVPAWERCRLLAGALEEIAAVEAADWPSPGLFQALFDLSGEVSFLAVARGAGAAERPMLEARAAELRRLESLLRSGAKAGEGHRTGTGATTDAPEPAGASDVSSLRRLWRRLRRKP